MKDKQTVIILNFDKGYMEWGKTLIESLSIHAPEEMIVAYTVNVSRTDQKKLLRLHPNISIHNKKMFFLSEKFKRHFMINRKANVFLKGLRDYPGTYYVLLDTDMILIKPISELITECNNCKAAVIYRDHEVQYHMKLNASLVLINRDKGGESLIKRWKKIMSSNLLLKTVDQRLSFYELLRNRKPPFSPPVRVRKGSWFWDQLTLYYAVIKSGIEYKNLPLNIFLNTSFAEEAVFWSAHSGNKKTCLDAFRKKVKEMKGKPSGD